MINSQFERKLRKFYSSVERKVVESGNRNDFFRFMRSRLQGKARVRTLVGSDGSIARTNAEKVDLLADVFERSVKNVQGLPEHVNCTVFPVMEDSFWCSKTEILELLLKWPKSSSITPDHIPLSFLQAVAHLIAGPLEYLYNLSFMRAEIPLRWKTSYVTPLPKKPRMSRRKIIGRSV